MSFSSSMPPRAVARRGASGPPRTSRSLDRSRALRVDARAHVARHRHRQALKAALVTIVGLAQRLYFGPEPTCGSTSRRAARGSASTGSPGASRSPPPKPSLAATTGPRRSRSRCAMSAPPLNHGETRALQPVPLAPRREASGYPGFTIMSTITRVKTTRSIRASISTRCTWPRAASEVEPCSSRRDSARFV